MNNLNVLPIYRSVYEQNHRKDYAFGEKYSLATPTKQILPFQFQRAKPPGQAPSLNIVLRNLDGSYSVDITAAMSSRLSYIDISPIAQIVMFRGERVLSITPLLGEYYLEFNTGAEPAYYSEVFTFVDNISEFLKLEYSCENDIVTQFNTISFDNDFKFVAYIPTQLSRPEYVFEEDVTQRDGFTFFEKAISYKKFKFDFVAPEYLIDALRIARICDTVQVTSKFFSYAVNEFLLTPEWLDGGFLASVQSEFTSATVLKNINNLTGVQSTGITRTDYTGHTPYPPGIPPDTVSIIAESGVDNIVVSWSTSGINYSSFDVRLFDTLGNLIDTKNTTQSTYSFDGLAPGNYSVDVVTRIAAQKAAPSNRVSLAVAIPFTKPVNLVGAPASGSVHLTWDKPVTGNPTHYDVVAKLGASVVYAITLGAITQTTVPGLVNGTEYEFYVVAKNAAYESEPSDSIFVTPAVQTGAYANGYSSGYGPVSNAPNTPTNFKYNLN